MAEDGNKQSKRGRGRPPLKVTKKRPFLEDGYQEIESAQILVNPEDDCPYDFSLLTDEDRRKVMNSWLRARAEGSEPEIVHPIMRNPPKPQEYVKLIILKVEGESPVVGPLNAPNTHGSGGAPLWIYRGEEIIAPAWVLGNLDGMKVMAQQCDMSVQPPYYYEAEVTRAPYHVIQRGLTRKDYEDFKVLMSQKKYDPFKQIRTATPA